MSEMSPIEPGDAIRPGNPPMVHRYTLSKRINHWVGAIAIIVLLLSGLSMFHPSLFFLSAIFGGGQNARAIHPWFGVILFLSTIVLFFQFWRLNLWRRSDLTWTAHIGDLVAGHEEKMPESGKYNAGQKFVFWAQMLLILALFCTGHHDLGPVFLRYDQHRNAAAGSHQSRDLRNAGDPGADPARLCRHLGPGQFRRYDKGMGAGRLGLAPSSRMAACVGWQARSGGIVSPDSNRGPAGSGGMMSDTRSLEPDPSVIGGVSKAPFAYVPVPSVVFARRAERFRMLAKSGNLAPYLSFLAAICDAQGAILPLLAEPALPAPELIARARQYDMPPLDRGAFKSDATLRDTCRKLFDALASVPMPGAAQKAFAQVRTADDEALDAMIAHALANSIPEEAVAEHVFVAAALQVHFARLASRLDAGALVPVGVGACPVCGGRPVASMIAGWHGAETARYASCMLCATLWNEVRVKCLVCSSTKGIGYQEIDGQGGTIKAETCDECGSYVKVLYQDKDVMLEPIADDVGSLGLDQLLRESPWRRAGLNPFLAGY